MPTSLKITVGAIPVASRTTSSLAGLHDGIVTNASHTVADAIEDWLADGLAGRAPKTISTQREVLEPLIDIIGAVPLRRSLGLPKMAVEVLREQLQRQADARPRAG
jgi:hypothetical protein